MKCVACGGEGLVGGELSSESDMGKVCFRLADRSYLSRFLGLGSKTVRAYGCVRCGHLQLAVEFDEKDLRRFLEFEGQQPGVLERINDEEGGPAGRDG
ncbi:MAG TPA: hypothetical protein VF297_22600 [Pyrinomonadaceae bacterium]